jgi:hypothetical protein
MVRRCDECGEYAFATRYKDSLLSFCRACGYWRDPEDEGVMDEEDLERMREKYPLHGYTHAPYDADPSLWADG